MIKLIKSLWVALAALCVFNSTASAQYIPGWQPNVQVVYRQFVMQGNVVGTRYQSLYVSPNWVWVNRYQYTWIRPTYYPVYNNYYYNQFYWRVR